MDRRPPDGVPSGHATPLPRTGLSAPRPSRRRRALLAGCVAALGLVVGLEVVGRLFEASEGIVFPADQPGRKYAHRHVPDVVQVGKSYQVNTDGFRDREFTREKRPGTLRIAALGDSVTFAAVAPVEAIWPRVAEGVLKQAGWDVEVYNFAIHGYDVEQCAATLRHVVWGFDPDLVVYGYFTNDHIPSRLIRVGEIPNGYVHVDTDIAPAETFLPVPLARTLVRHSALFRRIQGTYVAFREGERLPDAHLLRPDRILPVDATDFVATHLDAMVADTRAHGVPLVVYGLAPHVLATADSGHCDQYRFPGFCRSQEDHLRTVRRMVEDRGVPWVDSIAAWRASGKPHFFPTDMRNDPLHPSVEGQAVLGRWFGEWLLRERAAGRILAR